ncbi:glutamine synthetase family protein [Streptomyces sp. NPDC002680]|uniref:glutamine synthetase family protein n=1 Tax=Streptomyces sp. NPDC002680 TaxID=3364659 RepID=UPI0036927FDB
MTSQNPQHDPMAQSVGLLSVDELTTLVTGGEITAVMVGVPDMMGRLKGKILDPVHFLAQFPAGPDMCAYVFASDVDMNTAGGFGLAGWHTGYGDLHVVPDRKAIRRLSYLPGTVLVLGDVEHPDGTAVDVAPRRMLREQLRILRNRHQLDMEVGVESEFVLYQGTEAQIRDAGYQGLTPASPHNLDYALEHPPVLRAFFHDLQDAQAQARSPVEAVKTEGAAGQVEVTWPYGDPVRACDTYTVHKHAARHIAARHGMTPTFMAAPQTGVGSGLHLHVSLWRDGVPAFTPRSPGELPDLLLHSVAGLLGALPHLAPLYAPTTNSYKRYATHSFAPTNFTWGVDNRTCAVRVAGHRENTRLEVRLAGADANPYLVLAAVIAAINHGLAGHPKLPEPVTGDAYTDVDSMPVPRTLDEALTDFRESHIARHAVGPEVVDHYTRAAEIEIAAERGQVTDIDRERGFLRA